MRKLMLSLLAILCVSHVATAQNLELFAKLRPGSVLLAQIDQPDCPIKIEKAVYVIEKKTRRGVLWYRVRNISSKPLMAFAIYSWNMEGTGGVAAAPHSSDEKPLLLPGQTREVGRPDAADSLEVFSDEKRGESDSGIRAILLIEIHFVIMSDGSSYDFSATSEQISDFLSNQGQPRK